MSNVEEMVDETVEVIGEVTVGVMVREAIGEILVSVQQLYRWLAQLLERWLLVILWE